MKKKMNSQAASSRGKKSITPKDELMVNTLDQRESLSFYDTKTINDIYCANACANSKTKCENGGYPHPNSCNTCACPSGLKDDCTKVADSGRFGKRQAVLI